MNYLELIEEWQDIEVWNKDKTVMVEWEWIGEGISGDWQKDDEEDYPHLRFTVYRINENNELEQVDDASYCTELTIATSEEDLKNLGKCILNIVENRVKGNRSIKRLCEELSWILFPIIKKIYSITSKE